MFGFNLEKPKRPFAHFLNGTRILCLMESWGEFCVALLVAPCYRRNLTIYNDLQDPEETTPEFGILRLLKIAHLNCEAFQSPNLVSVRFCSMSQVCYRTCLKKYLAGWRGERKTESWTHSFPNWGRWRSRRMIFSRSRLSFLLWYL